jgi:hypothetical protein
MRHKAATGGGEETVNNAAVGSLRFRDQRSRLYAP